jgi:hypothetical protein
MADAIKFSEEELKQITDLQKSYNELVYRLGQVTLSSEGIKRQKEAIMKGLEESRAKEDGIAKSLNDKYGAGSLDLDSGTFTPTPPTKE